MSTKNKNKVTFSTDDTPENPISFQTFFINNTDNLGTKCTNVSCNKNDDNAFVSSENKEKINLENKNQIKRKLTNQEIISKAKKLPKIPISEAKENLEKKLLSQNLCLTG